MKNKKVTQLFAGLMVTALVVTGIVPPTTAMAATKTVTIKTQAQLEAALKDKKVTQIVIKTSKGAKFTIKDGDYGKKSLIVSSPKATVNNYGDFKKVELRDAKTVYDRGDGNSIVVKDTNSLKLYAGKQSTDAKITISAKGGKINIVNNGSVDAINVKGKSTVTVSGSAKEAPTITNNATGAKIVAAMDTNVVLNKKATLTVKAGTSLESLTTKADANITIAKGAEVKNISVSGKAGNVALKVDGTVRNVTVDTKADVSVSGSTTGTVAITNNAEGANITSEVKTDVTLNANAKISLDKGAEGSSVTAGNENVKPDVTNNTSDKVTVTDSTGKDTTVDSGSNSSGDKTDSNNDSNKDQGNAGGGSTGGGSTGGGSGSGSGSGSWSDSGSGSGSGGGGSQEDKTLSVSASISIAGEETPLKPGVILVANATEIEGAEYTYSWKRNGVEVGTEKNYTLSLEDSGHTLTVTVSASKDGKSGSSTATSGLVNIMGHVNNTAFGNFSVDYDTALDAIKTEVLPQQIEVFSEMGEPTMMNVAWKSAAESEYSATTPGVYDFKGTVTLADGWLWNSGSAPELTASVIVVGENPLKYTADKPKKDFTNTDAKGNDNSASTKKNQDAVTVTLDGYDCIIKGNILDLDTFLSSEESQNGEDGNTKHAWIAININFGVNEEGEPNDINGNLYYGTEMGNVAVINKNEPEEVAAKNELTLWVKADEIQHQPITHYMKYGEDGTVTPITVSFVNEPIELTELTSEVAAEKDGGKYGNVTTELELPETLDFKAGEKTYTLNVGWVCNKAYNASSDAGEYVFASYIQDGQPVILGNIQMPTVIVTVAKAEKAAPADEPLNFTNVTDRSFTISTEETGLEYFVSTEISDKNNIPEDAQWTTDTTFDAAADTTYHVFARYAETDNYLASGANAGQSVTTKETAIALGTIETEITTEINAGTYGSATDQEELGFPTSITCKTAADAETGYKLALEWSCDKEYSTTADAGTYTFTASPADEQVHYYDTSNLEIPAVVVTIEKAAAVSSAEKPEIKSQTATSFTVTTSAGIEYACSTVNEAPQEDYVWGTEGVFENLLPGTYYVFARVAETANYLASAASEGTSVTLSEEPEVEDPETPAVPEAQASSVTLGYEFNQAYAPAEKSYAIAVDNENSTADLAVYNVTGDLLYVANCAAVPGDAAEELKSGYYVPVRFEIPDAVTSENIKVAAVTGNAFRLADGTVNDKAHCIILVRIEEDQKLASFTLDLDGDGAAYTAVTYKLDAGTVTFTPAEDQGSTE